MRNEIKTVKFYGSDIVTAERNGVYYAAMKPICEAIGVQWQAQYNRIMRHPVLKSTVSMMDTVAVDGKSREMLMLPIEYLNGWLFGIDVNRVNPEIKDKLIAYQRECFRVLDQYWRTRSLPDIPERAAPSKCNDDLHLFVEITRGRTRTSTLGNPYNTVSMTMALVLRHLYRLETDGQEVQISANQISRELKIDRRTVSRSIGRLEKWSFLTVRSVVGYGLWVCIFRKKIEQALNESRQSIRLAKQEVGFLPSPNQIGFSVH